MPTMHGFGLGVPWAKQCAAGGSPPAPWTPADATPLFWVDIPAARADGRLFTTSAKTTAAVALADPVGAIVQEAGIGYDLIQATTSRRYALAQLSDGQWALLSDGVDDGLFSTTFALPSGAKTVGFRLEYWTALGATELDVPLTLGGSTTTTRVYLTGTSSGNKGISFICDVAGTATASRRYSGLAVSSGVPVSVVIAYNGGSISSTASYRLFIDGVEATIDATGATMSGSGNSTLLCASTAISPASAKISKVFAVTGDQSAKISRIQSYLVAP